MFVAQQSREIARYFNLFSSHSSMASTLIYKMIRLYYGIWKRIDMEKQGKYLINAKCMVDWKTTES